MRQWQGDLRAFLLARGMTNEELAEAEAEIRDKLDEPDGTPHDPPRSWQRLLDLILEAQGAAWRADWQQAKDAMGRARERWRIEHDRDADWTYGLMAQVVARHGEEAIPDMYRHIAGPLFHWRYAKFDVDRVDWDTEGLPTLMYVTLEAMRAHLCTRRRDGAPLELIEHDDRWEVKFDPCGSVGGSSAAMRWRERRHVPSRPTSGRSSSTPTTGPTARPACASTAITARS